MSREILQGIIDSFSPDKFIRFFREKNRSFAPHQESFTHYNDEYFFDGIKLGEIKFSESEKLLVCAFKVNQPLSERSGKKLQYEKGKKLLKDAQADAGIFIFYDRNENFRFSLIYDIPKDKGHRDWSTFRRFTYLVSKELTNKTFLQRIGDGNFSSLEEIKEAFSVEKVTKDFYIDISYWYSWAIQKTSFPSDAEKEDNGRNIAIIRMITRLIFIWFMKEKGLVPKDLFESKNIMRFLKDISPNKTTYYKAILQNLFFATLNTKTNERKFRFKKSFQGKNAYYMDHSTYRYEDYFKKQEDMLEIFKDIPFLNGGLFDCLDRPSKENDHKGEIRVDGFSDEEKGLKVPNDLFFSEEISANLNKDYGTKNRKYKVRGLINILSAYNFTIDENDPNDQEVALDPELLGKVFENLLASFNPETATTARKATGSYNTPRAIVDYMVSHSLKEYLKTHLRDVDELDSKIETLFSHTKEENPFNPSDTSRIIKLINHLRIIDPAVGSGAFPMGILNKLVLLLSKLDPENILWEETQIKVIEESIPDPIIKQKLKEQIKKQFKEKNVDYGRKLYLIQNCIYGVDIQQIAVEIAKLRFFISLLVDEKLDKAKENCGIEPLPNLEYKIMQGNSLMEEYEGIKLFDERLLNAELPDEEELESIKKKIASTNRELLEYYKKNPSWMRNPKLERPKELLALEAEQNRLRQVEKDLLKLKENPVNDSESPELFPMEKKESQKVWIELEELHKRIFEPSLDVQEKREIKQKIEALEWQLIEETLKEENKSGKLEMIQKLKKSNTKPFFLWKLNFPEVFQEKGGFDVVIANPPYIKEYVNREAFDGLRKSPYYKGKMDIWCFFACKGIDYLKDNGLLTFIAQNNWVTSYGASIMKNKVISESKILNLLDFGNYKIFESAGIQTMVMLFQKNNRDDNYNFDYRRVIGEKVDFDDILDLLNYRVNPANEYLQPKINRNELINQPLTFSNSQIDVVLEKMLSKSDFYLNKNEVAQGIVYPQDCVNRTSMKILGDGFKVRDGIFVLSGKEKKNIPFLKNELELIKPCYTTKELHKWYGNPKNSEWVIYNDSSFKNPKNIKPYPNIKAHLDKFRRVITSDNKPYGLHRARDEYFFKGKKIIALRKCSNEPVFTYTDFDCYVSATFYVIKTERLSQEYLTALLNSKLIAFWFRHKGKMQGNNYQIDKEPLLALPIYKPSEQDQMPIIAPVDSILAITKDKDYSENPAKQTNVHDYEKQIDQLVYKLYDLTPQEIAIVEGSNSNLKNIKKMEQGR